MGAVRALGSFRQRADFAVKRLGGIFFRERFFSRICFNAAPGRQRPDACIYLCRRAPRRGFENSGFPERIWRLKFLPAARGALQAPVGKIAARAAPFFIMPCGNYRGLIWLKWFGEPLNVAKTRRKPLKY